MRRGEERSGRDIAVEEIIVLEAPKDTPMTRALLRILRYRGLEPALAPIPPKQKIAPLPVLVHDGRRVGGFDAILAHLDAVAPQPLAAGSEARAAVEGLTAGWLEDASQALAAVADRKAGAALAARTDLWRALGAAVAGGRWLGGEEPSAADIAWGAVVESLPHGARMPAAIRDWIGRLRAHRLVARKRKPPRSWLARLLFAR